MQQKLAQHCKSTILQLKKKTPKNVYEPVSSEYFLSVSYYHYFHQWGTVTI